MKENEENSVLNSISLQFLEIETHHQTIKLGIQLHVKLTLCNFFNPKTNRKDEGKKKNLEIILHAKTKVIFGTKKKAC
jgi:hypothetical protein